MIQSLMIQTSGGLPIFSWNWKGIMEKSSTHEYLVTGVISAIESLVRNVFQSRLQRIELETGILVITGEEFVYTNEAGEKITNLLIISAFTDLQDNKNLVDKIVSEILRKAGSQFQSQSSQVIKDLDIKEWLEPFLEKKTMRRTPQKVVLAGSLSLLSLLISTLFFSINYEIWFSNEFKGILQVLIGIGIGFSLVTTSSFISGKREYGVISAIVAGVLAAFLGDFLIREVITSPIFDSSVGTFIAYFAITLLVSLIAGYTGGYLAERTFLFIANTELYMIKG